MKWCFLKPIIDVLVFIIDDNMVCVEVINVTFDNYFLTNCFEVMFKLLCGNNVSKIFYAMYVHVVLEPL